ncbi:MAG: ComF family protein, partial [Anaerolineaceae bacterium]|nr:ComF family protein [Anaerolineaceae bacterium]
MIREAIHHLKYQNDIGVSRVLAGYLLKVVQAENWDFDLIVPVPLSRRKFEQRGYNQAERLAIPLTKEFSKPLSTTALIRIKENDSQVNLDVNSRRENVRGVFEADPAVVKGKKILLVDDVLTTGATMESASQALKDANSGTIYAVTVGKSD